MTARRERAGSGYPFVMSDSQCSGFRRTSGSINNNTTKRIEAIMRNRPNHLVQMAQKKRRATSGSHFSPMEPLEPRELMSAAVYTVTNTLDNSHHGSLRWAINQVNKDAGKKGTDTINFEIAGLGTQTIALSCQLPTIKYSVVIDGTTQPGTAGSPLIEIDGSAITSSDALVVNGDGSSVQGLAIDHFARAIVANGDNDIINENVIGAETVSYTGGDNGFKNAIDVFGSHTAVTNNTVFSHQGTELMLESGSNANQVIGNTFTDGQWGINDAVDSDYNVFKANTVGGNYVGLEIDGHHNQVGDGQWFDSNTIGTYDNPDQIGIDLNSGQNSVVTNWFFFDYTGVVMGANTAEKDTVTGEVKSIAGNHNTVQDNFIADGVDGIALFGVHGNTIGGSGTVANGDSQSNTIYGNTDDGIYVDAASYQNTFSKNSIDKNGPLGIDLSPGANDSQPAPTLYSASIYNDTSVYGTFQGAADSTFHLEFFATPSGTANQGANYIGSIDVTTDDQGNLDSASITDSATRIDVFNSGSGPEFYAEFYNSRDTGNALITATATSQVGDTSAFSNPVTCSIYS